MPSPMNGTSRASKQRRKRRAAGLCVRCVGTPRPARPGMVTCGPCSAATSVSGFTYEEREQKRVEQRGLCALCLMNPCREADHCHTSGVKRALLCRRCNMVVGVLELRPWLIDAAEAYIDRYREVSH